jgi:hypothetical protein
MGMKKFFLILMMCLLPYQFAWAMVASYDTHGAQDTDVHFGHHEHQAMDKDTDNNDLAENDKSDKNTQKAKIHDHCGFLNLSCLELSSHDLPVFVSAAKQFSIQYLFNYHSSPNYQPERPNWIARA